MKNHAMILALALLSILSCDKKDPPKCIENCRGELCFGASEGEVTIVGLTTDYNNFYSRCLQSRLSSENAFNIYDRDSEGNESDNFYFSYVKSVHISWADLAGQSFSFKNNEEIYGRTGLHGVTLRWEVEGNDERWPDLVRVDEAEELNITFHQITDTEIGSKMVIECSGIATGNNIKNRVYAYIDITID